MTFKLTALFLSLPLHRLPTFLLIYRNGLRQPKRRVSRSLDFSYFVCPVCDAAGALLPSGCQALAVLHTGSAIL